MKTTIRIYLYALREAFFPRRYYVTTKAEREAVAAESRKWRKLVGVSLLVIPSLVVAGLHVIHESGNWMPRELK